MKIRYILLIFFSVLAVACSSDGGGGDSGSGNNGSGNNGGGNNGGGNNGGGNNNSTETTDPTDFTAMTSSGNTTYYVSFSSGNDSNDGKSEDKPFKNLGKINSITFKPGDKINFKSGDSWRGYFKVLGSGEESNKIEIGSYGSGNKPKIDGNGYQASIFLENVENISVSGLEFTNQASHKLSNGDTKLMHNSDRSGEGERFGILVLRYGNGRNISNISISDIKISDIYPTPSNSDNKHKGYGIRFESYNDSEINYYNNIDIDNVDISLTGHYGIHIVNRMSPANEDFYHRNISITNSKFTNTGGSGIVLARCKDILVENSHFNGTGASTDSRMWNRGSGMWTYTCNDATIQKNIFENAYGPQDSFGAHIDWGCKRVVMQYNLSKNNFGGFGEILGENEMCGYRYNISIGDGTRTGQHDGLIFWVSDFAGENRRKPSKNNFFYNNTIYVPSINSVNNNPMDHLGILFREQSEETYVYNNLIYISEDAKITFDIRNEVEFNYFRNNLYYGSLAISTSYDHKYHSSEIFNQDPLLSNAGGSSADDYKLKSGSPALKSGFLINGSSEYKNFIQNNGGKDFYGNDVSDSEKPNIGAYNGN